MRNAMDVFGRALYAYWKGDCRSKVYIVGGPGKKWLLPRQSYFRGTSQLTKLEKKLISLARGRILDVGCATGYYIPALMKKGSTEEVDISRLAIKVANEKGLKNCHTADIFRFNPHKKYDTITLLQNNLGMAGSVNRTRKMLRILSGLLKDDGQILLMRKKINKNFLIKKMRFSWDQKTSAYFYWMDTNFHFLSRLCDDEGLVIRTIANNRGYSLAIITKA